MSDGNDRCARCNCARAEHGECPKCAGHAFAEPMSVDDMVTVTDVFNSDRQLVRRTFTFDVTDERVHRYCVDCSVPPDLLRGEGVSLGISGPIPWGLEPDREIWGYIVGYDSTARRLEVAPKLDESGKFTITTPWIRLK